MKIKGFSGYMYVCILPIYISVTIPKTYGMSNWHALLGPCSTKMPFSLLKNTSCKYSMFPLTLISVHLVCRSLYLVSLTVSALICPPEPVLEKETMVISVQSHGYKHVVLDHKMGHVARKPVF